MKTEQKVISLELAKKLHDACIKFGVKEIESELSWLEFTDQSLVIFDKSKHELLNSGTALVISQKEKNVFEGVYPAPDCSELGEAMPDDIEYEKGNGYFYAKIVKNGVFYVKDKTEVECRGEMYLWLIINGYIK